MDPASPPPLPPPAPPGAAVAAAERSALVHAALVAYGVVTLFACGYALFSGTIRRFLGEEAPAAGALVAGAAIGGALAAATQVVAHLWAPFQRAAKAAERLLGPVTTGQALALAAASGLAEELLFRGALWPALGLAGTSLLFGLVHLIPRREMWVYPLFAAGAGLLLGLLRQATGSVFPPILAHVALNAINLAWIGKRARAAATPAAPGA